MACQLNEGKPIILGDHKKHLKKIFLWFFGSKGDKSNERGFFSSIPKEFDIRDKNVSCPLTWSSICMLFFTDLIDPIIKKV